MLQSLQALWRDVPGLVSDRVEILSLELQRAGLALLQIVMLVVVLAILGVTAWLVLWVGIVAGLVALGLHLGLALGLALLLNVGAAALAASRVAGLVHQLGLPATRRHLTLSPSNDNGPAHSEAPEGHTDERDTSQRAAPQQP
jgi:hypothetical protein